jgi:hypothetical protein
LSISSPKPFPTHSPPLISLLCFPYIYSAFSHFSFLLSHSQKQIKLINSKPQMGTMTMLYIVSLTMSLTMWIMVDARIPGVYNGGSWQTAHATFYGGSDASGTMGMHYVTL